MMNRSKVLLSLHLNQGMKKLQKRMQKRSGSMTLLTFTKVV